MSLVSVMRLRPRSYATDVVLGSSPRSGVVLARTSLAGASACESLGVGLITRLDPAVEAARRHGFDRRNA